MKNENKNPLIENLISTHVTEYLFPGETAHTPDVDSMLRAEKMGSLLRKKLTELHNQGIDITQLSAREVLGMYPDEIELTEDDYLSYI